MSRLPLRSFSLAAGKPAALCVILLGFAISVMSSEEPKPAAPPPHQISAFQPGETLTYAATWSNTVKMGSAVMEVKSERTSDGREVIRFVMSSRTEGTVGSLYPLGDIVQSVFDPEIMQPLSFSLHETQGKKVRRRDLAFDHEHRTVTVRKDEDPVKTFTVPDKVQDNLSSIYYLRSHDEFTVGKIISFDVFDGGQNLKVEVQVLGKEKVKTPAGEFDTIKIRAYKGLFMSEGEVFVWLTDDARKIPVLIKSKIKIGSVMFNLTGLKPGGVPKPET